MKKIISLFLVFLITVTLCSCSNNIVDDVLENYKEKSFLVKNYNLTFTATEKWKEDMEDTELDFCATDGVAYMGVFGYFKSDYLENKDFEGLLSQQTDSVLKDYDNKKQLDYSPSFSSEDKIINTKLFEIVSDDTKLYQYFYHIQFKEKDEFFWVSYTAIPSYAKINIKDFEKIIDSFNIAISADNI